MKPLIIIAGMHRSGTSFLDRCLNLSVVYLDDLESLVSHEWEYLHDNPRGHWENKEILNLTEKTLNKNNGSWDNIPSNIEVDPILGNEIQNYLSRLSNEPSLAYGFKDPRIIPCFESWKKYFPSKFIIIGIFRDPLKVAESLKKRNDFDYEKSINLWKTYNTKLIELVEKYNGFLIDFDQPKQKIFSEIKLIVNKLGLINSPKIVDWYDEKLLQSNKNLKSSFTLNEDIKSVYSNLVERSLNNEKIDFKTTEINLENQDVISSLFSQLYDQSKFFRNKVDQFKAELDTKNNKIEKDKEKIRSQNSEIDQLHNEISTKDSEISTKESQIDDLQSKYFEKSHELDQLKNSISFGIVKNFTNFIDRILPPNTKRGEKIKLLKMAYLTYKKEGAGGLAHATKQKYSFKKSPKISKNQKLTINFNDEELIDGVFLPKTKEIIKDSSLRKFLKFDYGNFSNLSSYPKVSVIILTFDQTKLLEKNIQSIKDKTTYSNYEIIVVTNNNDPDSDMRKLLKTLDCESFVYNDKYSFSKMNNFGATKAKGDFLIFLNDDVEIISKNWIESFLKLAENNSVGAIGGKLLFSDGRLQEAGCIFWGNGNAWNYGREKNPQSPEFNFVRNVDYCSASCLFVKKAIFDKIGGFDTSYHPAYAEDAELYFSIRNLGFQTLYQPQVEIIHYEGMTSGTKTTGGIKSYQIQNLKKFSKKWENVLSTYREDSTENAFFERNRKDGLNILFVDHYVPEPDKDSGSLRTFRILGILSYLNHKVTFWPDNLKKSQPYTSELQQKGIEVMFGSINFRKFIDERKNFYDIAIISRPHIGPKYIDIIREKMPNCLIIYDTVDLHFLRMIRQSKLDDSTSKSELKKVQETELSLMENTELTFLTSMDEAKFLHPEYPQFRFALLPNIHIFEGEIPEFDSREHMMFIGNFQHPPNVDAATYILEEIFPKIQNDLPKVQLYVIGPNPPDKIKKFQSDSVHILGYVKNIDEYFNKCRIMLSPLRFGAGVKGKITQSLTRGLPTITTDVGAEGIGLTDGKNCMIANDAKSIADKATTLYKDSILWKEISTNGLKSAQFYSAENIKNTLESIISKCITR